MGTELRPAGFNYAVLPADVRRAAEGHAQAIHGLLRQTAANVIEIGRRLIEVHRQLGSRHYNTWLRAEFHRTQPVASNYEQVARKFANLACVEHFQPSALCILGRQKRDPRTVKAAIALARSGETITYKRANELVAQHEGPGRLAPHRLEHLRELVRSLAENITPADLDTLIDELGRLADELRQRRSQLTSSPHLTAAQA